MDTKNLITPPIDLAIEAGIVDRTRRIDGHGIVPSYEGSAVFNWKGRKWHALGYKAIVVGGQLVSNGYVDIVPLARTTASKESSGIAGWFRQLVAA